MPIGAYVSAAVFESARGPYWLAGNSDPAYPYLFNSLNILNLRAPLHIDHPGTTLQIAGPAVIGSLSLGNTAQEITGLVLANPEWHLTAIEHTLRAITITALFLTGMLFYIATRNLVAAILVQTSSLFASELTFDLALATPELLLYLTSTLMTGFMGLYLRTPQILNQRWLVASLGALSGFGLVTKITFLPVLFLPIILLRTVRYFPRT
jgi:hypothetical protein